MLFVNSETSLRCGSLTRLTLLFNRTIVDVPCSLVLKHQRCFNKKGQIISFKFLKFLKMRYCVHASPSQYSSRWSIFTTVDTATAVDTEPKSLKPGPANTCTGLIFLFHSDRLVSDLNMLCTHVRISVALVRKAADSLAKREYVAFSPFIGVIFMNRTGRATLSILVGPNAPTPVQQKLDTLEAKDWGVFCQEGRKPDRVFMFADSDSCLKLQFPVRSIHPIVLYFERVCTVPFKPSWDRRVILMDNHESAFAVVVVFVRATKKIFQRSLTSVSSVPHGVVQRDRPDEWKEQRDLTKVPPPPSPRVHQCKCYCAFQRAHDLRVSVIAIYHP